MSIKDFQILNKLGEGSFSSVWKVKRISDGQEYAMKKVKLAALSEKEKQNALNEVRILASIKNPFIVGYKEAFFEDNSMTLCVVMEYAGGGDILNKITKHQKANTYFKEKEIWNFATQMLIGLKTLHDMKILHRDLKCANIFLSTDGKCAKLGDLNVSKVTGDNLAYTQTGTPYYASPEVWSDKPYDMKSDIWSIGCVIYEMCALKPPFRANDMQGLYKKIQRGIFERIPSQYSLDMYNFISMCLQVKPAQRPSCDQLLSHPILQRNGQEVLETLEDANSGEMNELLGTIKLQKNIRSLAHLLPKANYEENPSPQVQRGRIESAHPLNQAKRDEIKRPISQHGSATRNKIVIRESPSKESRVTQMQKIEPTNKKEAEQDYLARMQREYIEKARAVNPTDLLKNQKSPRPAESKLPPRSPNYNRPISGKKNENPNVYAQPSPNYQRPISGNRNENPNAYAQPSPNYYQGPKIVEIKRGADDYFSRNNNRIASPQGQQRLNSRDRSREDLGREKQLMEKQEYLINKYQVQNQPQRVQSEKNDLLRKADYLLQKYQGVDVNKREGIGSREDSRRQISTPSGAARNLPQDILDRYRNIYSSEPNQRVQSAANPQSKKIDYQYQNNNLNPQKKYVGNDYNNIAKKQAQAQQLQGVVKPQWWG